MKKAYLVLWAVLITITGCKGGDTEKDQKFVEAENMVYAAYQVRDYERILTLADSLKMEGLFSEGKACYWLGYANDRLMRKRMAELYWKTGLAATVNSTEDEDVRVYAGIANRLFRTLASQAMKPAEILTHMNAELAEDNEQGMFVTMIICLLDLKSGRLEFSNAGHNPPVIGTANNQFSFLDMQPNAPVGLWPELEYEGETIDDISNKLLLLYTDGLNEAENQQQEQYGEDRIIRLLTTRFSNNTHDIVEALETDVNNFREGAEPNDDLTMLALMLKR